jgi:tripartite-type tricarboxylate transporter receptor subunit TctC
MLVPFPAGGGTDTVARTIADRMQTSLGRAVIIENLAGASGTLGVGRGARAAGGTPSARAGPIRQLSAATDG